MNNKYEEYEERVLSRARELAHVGYPKGYKLSEWDKIIEMARLSVKKEALAVHDALVVNNEQAYIHRYLERMGLIPPKTQKT